MEELQSALKNWVPEKILIDDRELIFKCLCCSDLPFTEPFFDDTLRKFRTLDLNRKQYKCFVGAEMINEWAGNIDFVPPTAFIFHVSRCGSTLVSQSLGLNNEFISLSEVPVLDQILRLTVSNDEEVKGKAEQLFKSLVKIYGAQRTGVENKLFIKTDCWHLMFYKQLRSLYPTTPFIIMYRQPAAVIESNKRSKGIQCIHSYVPPEIYGMEGKLKSDDLVPDNYFKIALEQFFRAIIEIAANENQVLLLNYNEGIPALMSKIAGYTGLSFSGEFESKILKRSAYHAKNPDEEFVEQNTAAKFSDITVLEELYNSIENIRLKSR